MKSLKDKTPHGKDFIQVVLKEVSDLYEIPVEQISEKTRKREVVFARQMAQTLSFRLTKCSLAIIGEEIGGKDHATVLHACKTIDNLADTDAKVSQEYRILYNYLASVYVLDKVSVCPLCGSTNVMSKVWIDPNTQKPVPVEYITIDEPSYCIDCKDHVVLIKKSEFDKREQRQKNLEMERKEKEIIAEVRKKNREEYENQLLEIEKEFNI
jgi:hypothetical protein